MAATTLENIVKIEDCESGRFTRQLAGAYRLLQPGEIVQAGDFAEIGNLFFLLKDGNSPSVGDTVEYVGAFSRFWSAR